MHKVFCVCVLMSIGEGPNFILAERLNSDAMHYHVEGEAWCKVDFDLAHLAIQCLN